MKLLIVIICFISLVLSQPVVDEDKKPKPPTCPLFTCENYIRDPWYKKQQKIGINDAELLMAMNDTLPQQVCYQHSEDDPVTHIRVLKCKNPEEKCMVNRGEYSWVSNELQFTPVDKRKNFKTKSQVYGNINTEHCKNFKDSVTDRLNGRKCDNSYQC